MEILNIKKSRILKNKKYLSIFSDLPFFLLSICGIKFIVILSQSIAEILDKIEWLLVIILLKVWFR